MRELRILHYFRKNFGNMQMFAWSLWPWWKKFSMRQKKILDCKKVSHYWPFPAIFRYFSIIFSVLLLFNHFSRKIINSAVILTFSIYFFIAILKYFFWVWFWQMSNRMRLSKHFYFIRVKWLKPKSNECAKWVHWERKWNYCAHAENPST